MVGLRQKAATYPAIASGSQVEVLVQCALPTPLPEKGVVAVRTLVAHNQIGVLTGYNITNHSMVGFSAVSAGLGARTDEAPVPANQTALELRVYVDGHLVETFFSGDAVITTVTANLAPSASISSSFVNTAALSCQVTSWTLGLDKGLSTTNAARHFKTDDRGPRKKILPAGPCVKAEDCSLNGECVSGRCVCTASWSGHNCERLALRPLPAEYGYGRTPKIT